MGGQWRINEWICIQVLDGEIGRWMDGWTDGRMDGWTHRHTHRWVGEYLDKRAATFAKEAAEGGAVWLRPSLWFPPDARSHPPTFLALLLVTSVETVRLPVADPGQGDACAVLLALERGSANCGDTEGR